jgi:hypothetical protein
LPAEIYCQSIQYAQAGRYTSLGAYSENFVDVLSFTTNQAALGELKTFGAAVYTERKFFLEELSLFTVATCIPVSFGGIGVSARSFGYDAYKENQLNLAYGKALGKMNIGIQFSYYGMQIPGYGKEALLTIEGGIILQLSDKIFAGLHVFNPTGRKFGNYNLEKLAAVYSTGFGYEVSEKVFLAAEIIKEEERPVKINVGLQYVFAKKLFTRFGTASYPAGIFFGSGWKWNNLRLDVTANYHSQLGFTPGLMLVFEINDKEE